MKITANFEAVCVGKKTELSKDGKTTYYRVSIEQNDESSTLPVAEEIYERLEKYTRFKFTGIYDDKYQSFRIVGAMPAGAVVFGTPQTVENKVPEKTDLKK